MQESIQKSLHEEQLRYTEEEKELRAMKRKKIMVIDDDQDFRLALSEMLVDNGYEVITAKDGETALNQLVHDRDPPDLIMVDVVMPIKGGLEFRREQARLSHVSQIPVIFMTGHGLVDSELCLQKPFNEDELVSCLRRYI